MIKNNCPDIEAALDAYHDGEVSQPEREVIGQHLANCPACQLKLAQIEQVVKALADLPKLAPSRDFTADLDNLLARKPQSRNNIVRPLIWGSVGVAAAAAAVLIIGFAGHSPNPAISVPSAVAVRPAMENPADNTVAANQNAAGEDAQPSKQTQVADAQLSGLSQPKSNNESLAGSDKTTRSNTAPESVVISPKLAEGPADGVTYVALNDGEQGVATEALGISTDEDGLYAIKL